MKFPLAVVASLIYLCVLFVVYLVHIKFFSVNVIFYAAIADAVIAAVIGAIILLAARAFGLFNAFEKLQLFAIWLLVGYCFAISLPTVIDRSLSFYILEKLEQRGGGIKADRMADVFINEYMKEYRLVDVRLTEQEQSGTITVQNGCVKLTPKGRFIAAFSSYFRAHLLPAHRLLGNQYTDALVHPIANSIAAPDYLCQ